MFVLVVLVGILILLSILVVKRGGRLVTSAIGC